MNEELIVILQSLKTQNNSFCHKIPCAGKGIRCINCIFFTQPWYSDFILKVPVGVNHG